MTTLSMTPGPAIMPMLATPPSSAGPAAPAQATSQSLFPRTTSALVPTSTRMETSSLVIHARGQDPGHDIPAKVTPRVRKNKDHALAR